MQQTFRHLHSTNCLLEVSDKFWLVMEDLYGGVTSPRASLVSHIGSSKW